VVRFDRRSALTALPLGPVLILAGYVGLATAQTPITDAMLVGLLVYPAVALLLGAVVTAVLRRDATVWVSMAACATIGTVALAIVVGGGISALASMLSDPG
jgi:hypothetical protein